MDSTKKTHKDWALVDEWLTAGNGLLGVNIYGKMRWWGAGDSIPGPHFPCRAFSPKAKEKRREAVLSMDRVRWAEKLRRLGRLSLNQVREARYLCETAFGEAQTACCASAIERLRTAPKSSTIGRLRSRIIQAVPELLQLYEARELAAAAKKRKPVATTQRGRL